MDAVAKEGQMFLQGVKFGKRIWRRTWVMLFQPSAAGIGRVEMYDVRAGQAPPTRPAVLKKADKQVLRLAECLSVTPAPGESCPTGCAAFYLNTPKRIYTLAAPPRDDWVPALCHLAFQRNEGVVEPRRDRRAEDLTVAHNDLYSTWCPTQFQVRVASTVASVRCSMSGSYLLSPEREYLCLLDMKSGQVVFDWPYRALRKFGLVKEGVSIEAGRRCHTGEGQFVFLTAQGQQIYRAIEEAVMHQSVQDLLSEATALSQGLKTKPPPPPPPSGRPAPKTDATKRNFPLPRVPGSKPKAEEVEHVPTKPLPRPRTRPPVWVPPGPRSAPQPGHRGQRDHEEHDYEVCEWNPESIPNPPDTQLYSVVTPHGRAPTSTELPRDNPQQPPWGPPPDFKRTLADALLKGRTRVRPPLPPKPPRQTKDQSFNDYEDPDEVRS